MQTQNRLFDDLARVAGGALGALSGLREEIELLVRQRLERVLADMDMVSREEFDAVKAMAAEARAENERLAAQVAALEARVKPTTPSAAAAKAAATPAASRRRPPRRSPSTPKKAAAKPTSAAPTPPPEGGDPTE